MVIRFLFSQLANPAMPIFNVAGQKEP